MKNLLEYYDIADWSNMSKKAGGQRFESGVYKKSHHGEMQPPLLHGYIVTCYIVTCYIKDFTSTSRSSATSWSGRPSAQTTSLLRLILIDARLARHISAAQSRVFAISGQFYKTPSTECFTRYLRTCLIDARLARYVPPPRTDMFYVMVKLWKSLSYSLLTSLMRRAKQPNLAFPILETMSTKLTWSHYYELIEHALEGIKTRFTWYILHKKLPNTLI